MDSPYLVPGGTNSDRFPLTAPDRPAPELTCLTGSANAFIGQPRTIEASATDPGGIAGVTLHYRDVGATAFKTLPLTLIGGGRYEATIPGVDVTATKIEYYVRATDTGGNVAYAPAGGTYTLTPKGPCR